MSDIKTRVINITAERLNIKAEDVQEESKFVEDLGADSLDLVELVMGFEEEFDVEIPDEEAEEVTSVKAAIDKISSKL